MIDIESLGVQDHFYKGLYPKRNVLYLGGGKSSNWTSRGIILIATSPRVRLTRWATQLQLHKLGSSLASVPCKRRRAGDVLEPNIGFGGFQGVWASLSSSALTVAPCFSSIRRQGALDTQLIANFTKCSTGSSGPY